MSIHTRLIVICLAFVSINAITSRNLKESKESKGSKSGKKSKDKPAPQYDKFQGLGFAIYTGPGEVFDNSYLDENCEDIATPGKCTEYLGSDGLICKDPSCPKDIPFSYGGSCLTCYTIFNECGCDVNGDEAQCKFQTGVGVENGKYAPLCYLGNEDTAADVKGRLAIMEAAVERAYTLSDKTKTTLKIFNAPEFFWRGANGAYPLESILDDPEDESNALNEIGNGLQKLVQQSKFKDWLFVFGTVILAGPSDADGEFEYLNFAPVYKGFDPKKTDGIGMSFLVPKRYVSTIDFLYTDRLSEEAVPKAEPYSFYSSAAWTKLVSWLDDVKGYTPVYNTFFVVNDIVIALEICLDHSYKVAQQNFLGLSTSDLPIPLGGDGSLSFAQIPTAAQVSIITSAGMSINPYNTVVKTSGSIFLQDGLNPLGPDRQSLGDRGMQTCSVNIVDEFLGTTDGEAKRICTSVDEQDYNVYSTEEQGTSALLGLFSTSQGLPKIRVYEPVAIPAI
jgi:hypothetical protein